VSDAAGVKASKGRKLSALGAAEPFVTKLIMMLKL